VFLYSYFAYVLLGTTVLKAAQYEAWWEARDRAIKINDSLHKVLHTFYYDFQQKFVTVTGSKPLLVGPQGKRPGIYATFKV
jgi:hypothetical protein